MIFNVLINVLKKIKYKGTKYHCPICHFSSNDLYFIGIDHDVNTRLQVIGAGKRKAGCHICHSTDRERLVYVFLKSKAQIFKNNTLHVLHIAPEKPIMAAFIRHRFENYVCGDKYEPGYTYDSNVVNLDITSLDIEENHFDLIICNHVLEHIDDDRKAMKELYRVLKLGGKAILQVPFSPTLKTSYEEMAITQPKEREKHFGQSDHVRVYGLDYFQRLEETGFKVEKMNLSHTYPNDGLNPEEDLIYCTK
jgi:SAM-dependent methyltransferase